jgi:hypothetical protein
MSRHWNMRNDAEHGDSLTEGVSQNAAGTSGDYQLWPTCTSGAPSVRTDVHGVGESSTRVVERRRVDESVGAARDRCGSVIQVAERRSACFALRPATTYRPA